MRARRAPRQGSVAITGEYPVDKSPSVAGLLLNVPPPPWRACRIFDRKPRWPSCLLVMLGLDLRLEAAVLGFLLGGLGRGRFASAGRTHGDVQGGGDIVVQLDHD